MAVTKKRLARSLFPTVLVRGRRFSSANLSIVFYRGDHIDKDDYGYAVVVPKKVARLATTRNRMKRRVRAVMNNISFNTAFIIFPKLSSDSVSYKDIEKELRDLIEKHL